MLEITRTSIVSGAKNTMKLDVTMHEYLLWREGMLIQEAMPNLSAVEREFLITGMSEAEQADFYVQYKLYILDTLVKVYITYITH